MDVLTQPDRESNSESVEVETIPDEPDLHVASHPFTR